MTKQQKRAMYAAAAAQSAVHREVDQYEDDNVGTQALSEGEKAAGNVRDISKSIYARKLKKKAKMQGKKGAKTAKSSPQKPTAAQDAGASGTGEGSSNWLSRWRQKQDIRQSYYAAAHSGTAAQTAGGKTVSNGTTAAKSGMEQIIDKGRSVVSTAVNGIANFAKSNAHVLVIVGVFLLLLLLVMSAFSSCSILFSGTTQVSGQTIYTAEDRDIKGAETDYKKLEKDLDKKIKRTPTDHPGYDEYQYHLDEITHDPWQLTSFLTTLYDDYTRSEVQGKLKETFKKQYKLTTWVEVQTRYRTVVMIDIFTGIPYTTQVPYQYKIFHTKLENRGLEVVIREELTEDQWKRYEIFQDAFMKNKIIGVCPNCGANVVEREKGWFCESNPCRFVLWKDNAYFKRLGKRLDAHVADKLLRDGRVRLKDCKSAKGKTYNATVLLSCEADGRSKFSLEFEGGC